MAAPKKGTKKRILDAAERLFAEKGFNGTSTRAIVAASGDTIGTLNYHFNGKDKLFAEVIQRRFIDLMDARRTAYKKACLEAEGNPSLEAVVESIILPFLEFVYLGPEGWRSYVLLQASVLHDKSAYEETMAEASEGYARELMQWLKQALPGSSAKDLGYAYQFMFSSMIGPCAESGTNRIKRITNGECDATDFQEVSSRLIPFICAGLFAIVPLQPGQSPV